jgi:tRNA-modifying protein YgfZ
MGMNGNAYEALRKRAAYIDLTGRGNLRATGEDRTRLLHAMTTNHIEQLQPGTGCYAFFLTSQGRILADANIFCMPDYYLLDTEPETKDRVREHLDKFIIADDVTVCDFTECAAVINIEGPAAETVMNEMGAPAAHLPYTIAEWEHGTIARISYTGSPGYSVMIPVEHKDSFIARLAAAEVPAASREDAEIVRLEHGRPRFGVDFSDSNIAQETQLMHAVHTNKGCYLGQEIVERVRSRGHVNKLLMPLEVDTREALQEGTKVMAGDAAAGEITSAAYSPAIACTVALAILRAELLKLPLTVAGVNARVRPVQQ